MASKADEALAAKKDENESKGENVDVTEASKHEVDASGKEQSPPKNLEGGDHSKASNEVKKSEKGALSNDGGNEFILVEDVDSSEPQASGMEREEELEGDTEEQYAGEEEPMEHGKEDGEYVEEPISQEKQDLHDVVNEVLDSKLEGFQVQIQKMFSMMQGTMEGLSDKDSEGGGVSKESPEGGEGEEELEEVPQSAGNGDVVPEKEPEQNIHEQKEWMEFLGRISDILGLPSTLVKSVLDETVGTSDSMSEYLPAEGIVKNSWQSIKGERIDAISHRWNKHKLRGYRWPGEDMEMYGTIPNANEDLVGYLDYFKQEKLVHGLPPTSRRFNVDLRMIESLFRFQQRIISYASYFTAAIGKEIAVEQTPAGDRIQEILKNLAQCLRDVCDTSVNGCALTTKSIRRLYADALGMGQAGSPVFGILSLPLSDKLFPPDALKKEMTLHGINLEKPHLSQKTPGPFRGRGVQRGQVRGRGTVRGVRGIRGTIGRGGTPNRGSMRGSPVQSRGAAPRGRGMTPRGKRGFPRGQAYPRGRGATPRGRGWQPRSRGANRGGPPRGMGMKRGPKGESPVAEKHRRIGPVEGLAGNFSSRYGEAGPGRHRSRSRESGLSPREKRRQSFSPGKQEKGVEYQSIPDDPSSYYRSPSEREFSPDRYDNEGWY